MTTDVTTPRRRLGSLRNGSLDVLHPTPYGWAPVVVLFIVGLVDRVENALTAAVLPLIQDEWGITDAVAGTIPTAAALAAAAVAIPAGYIADRWNRTRIIAVVVFIWAVTTLGTGFATSFAMFFLWRILLAAAESIDNPAAGSLLADYYPPITRAQAFGWTRVTAYLGGIGLIIGGILAEVVGWRATFFVMAVPGVLTAILVWRLVEPQRGALDRALGTVAAGAPAEGSSLAGGPLPDPVPGAPEDPPPARTAMSVGGTDIRTPAFRRQVVQVLRVPTMVRVSIAFLVIGIGLAGVFYWLPSLITRRFDVGTAAAGSTAGGVTVIGVLAGTFIGTWVGRRWHGRVHGGRMLASGLALSLGSIVLALAIMMNSLAALAVLLVLATTTTSISIPNLTAAIADVTPPTARGIGFAILQLLYVIGLALGPLMVGVISEASGSLATGILVLVIPIAVAGLMILGTRSAYERDARQVLEDAASA